MKTPRIAGSEKEDAPHSRGVVQPLPIGNTAAAAQLAPPLVEEKKRARLESATHSQRVPSGAMSRRFSLEPDRESPW